MGELAARIRAVILGCHVAKKNVKHFISDFIDRNTDTIACVSDSIFYFGELGMQEHESSRLLCDLLEVADFNVQSGISGFPTGFCATFGSGPPVIAMHTEYDANPNNSQVSGIAEAAPITPHAPGHCEGHNCNAAVLVAGAIATAKAMIEYDLPGTIKVFGAPGEEQLISRPYYVRDGWFDDVDVALHDHLGGDLGTVYGLTHSAAISAYFRFFGETSHASVTPWNGRDSLDAVVLMDMGMAQFREHMRPEWRAHRVIKEGGDQPNTIPAKTMVWWTFRAPTAEGAQIVFEQGKKIAQGAALMTNTEVQCEVMSAVWPVRTNQVLAEVIKANMDLVGAPDWNETEQDFAIRIQEKAGAELKGLLTEVRSLDGPSQQRAPSNDCGDVSWKVPMGRVGFPSNIPGVPFHHWTGGAALATSIAHKGAVVGSKVLAGTATDLLSNPDLIRRAKETFALEIGDVVYQPLIPSDQSPPVNLNREIMEMFRPSMREHYLKKRPKFN